MKPSSPRAEAAALAGKESATAQQFLKLLADSDLLPAEEIQAFTARATAAQKGNAIQLAQLLIRQKKLTNYQANMLLQGRTKGLVLGNYMVLDKLGAGGMGMVYKAKHRKMDRVVAIKVLSPAVTKSAKAVQRFKREVQVSSRLQHPNIVSTFDAGESGGVHFLVMEYVEGCDLSRLIKQQGPLAPAQAVGVILQAARGLENAHQGGVIHRDIKPSNLLLDVSGIVKILDLGLAREEEGNSSADDQLTKDGSVLGTCDYMAPEQALNSKNADQRADIYSLGCTLFYLITGKVMYAGSTMMEKLLTARETAAPSLRKLRPEISKALDSLYLKMVAKKVEDRPQSVAEVIAELERCEPVGELALAPLAKAAGKPTGTNADRTPVEAATDSRSAASGLRRSPKPVLIGAGAGLAVLVLLLIVLFRGGSGDKPVASAGTNLAPPLAINTRLAIPPDSSVKLPPPPPIDPVKPPPAKGFDEAWVRQVAALGPKQQFFAVLEKLRELNPGMKGRPDYRLDKGTFQIAELSISTDRVSDLSPLRAVPSLLELRCSGSEASQGMLSDLGPLQSLKLTSLICGRNPQLSDLTPLKGMPLRRLMINMTQVSDLAPLEGMQLEMLDLTGCPVRDLSALKGMPLHTLRMHRVPADSYSVLLDLPLVHVAADFKNDRDLEILQSIKTLKEINDQPAAAFFKKAITK